MCDWGRRKQALGGGEDRKSLISQKLGVENLNFSLACKRVRIKILLSLMHKLSWKLPGSFLFSVLTVPFML